MQDRSTRSTDTHSGGSDDVRRDALARELCALISIASIDELRAFGVIVRRVMGKGRESYGPLDLKRDPRNFKNERAEEKADALWYDVLDELREYDERLERLRCEAADEIAARIEPGLRELAAAAPQRPTPTIDECKARFEQSYGKGAPFDEPPVDPLPPPPVVSGAHALMDFDTGDLDEETKR